MAVIGTWWLEWRRGRCIWGGIGAKYHLWTLANRKSQTGGSAVQSWGCWNDAVPHTTSSKDFCLNTSLLPKNHLSGTAPLLHLSESVTSNFHLHLPFSLKPAHLTPFSLLASWLPTFLQIILTAAHTCFIPGMVLAVGSSWNEPLRADDYKTLSSLSHK